MTDLLPDPTTALPTPSRRAILGAAWTAPVVVAATAAPGYAASSAAALSFDTLTSYAAAWSGSDPTRIETQVQVQHVWATNAPTVSGVTVSVRFPASVAAGGAASAVSGEGWKAGSISGSADTAWTYTFTWSGRLAPSRSTPALAFQVPRRTVQQTSVPVTGHASAPEAPTIQRTVDARI